MKVKILSILAVILILIPSLIVHASNVTGAQYLTTVRVTNNSTATSNVTANFTLSTANMITAGMLNSSANECAIRDASGNDVEFQPGWGSNPWMTFVSSIGTSSQINQYLYTGNVTGGKIRWFPVSSGGTVVDSATLESSTNWTFRTLVNINTTSSPAYILDKTGTISIYRGATAGNVTATVKSSPGLTYEVSIGSLTDGEYLLTFTTNTSHAWMTIGGFSSAVITGGVNGIFNTAANWTIGGAAVNYMEYAEILVDQAQKGYWNWQYAATFTDQSGNGNTLTPTFRTTGTTNITATVISQAPTSTSSGPSANVTGGVNLIGGVPTAPSIFTTGAGSYPMKGEISQWATDSRIPYDALAKTLAIGSAILVFAVIFILTHRVERGIRGSLLFSSMGAMGILIYWWKAGGGVIEGWQLIPFGVFVVLLLLWRNPNTTPI